MKGLLPLVLLCMVAAGQQVVWTRTFHDSSYGGTVGTDTRGNVIAASAPWLRKFGPDGESLWKQRVYPHPHRALKVTVDRQDDILLSYQEDTTWTVTKFTPDGDSVWTRVIDWPREPRHDLSAISADSRNRILLTGHQHGGTLWLTLQLSPDGRTEWLRTFSSDWGYDRTYAICANPSDNVIVGGSRGIVPYPRMRFASFIKYSPDGESLAGDVYFPLGDTLMGSDLWGYGVAADPWGNTLLSGCGRIYPFPDENEWLSATFLFKYDPEARVLWRWFAEESDSAGHTLWFARNSIAADAAGNVLLVRPLDLPPNGHPVVELSKFLPCGEQVWVFLVPGLEQQSSTSAPQLALCPQGSIILAGKTTVDTAYVVKIDPAAGVTAEPKPALPRTAPAGPTINHGTLALPASLFASRPTLVTPCGRKVMDLQPSDNDVRHLAPGVYFIRTEEPSPQGVEESSRKIVIRR